MDTNIHNVRNIGISAHIDSGKTTLTERILYYTNKIHKIHDVKGKDDIGATMDFMDIERERGITIASAATFCKWKNFQINIIDTPGHVDFTIEVERSLRILDGAVLILCAVGGVQSQSITVNSQMKRYNIPNIVFINKCDRRGSNPNKVVDELKEQLEHNPIVLQLPLGLENDHEGVIDLISMKAIYFTGNNGEKIFETKIPDSFKNLANQKREELIDIASVFSDELMCAIIEEEEIDNNLLISAIRKGTISRELTPVLFGSAYKNKGVQPLLDAINNFLPSPVEIENKAIDLNNNNEPIFLFANNKLPTVAFAFKIEDGKYGQLTYVRVYQGSLKKGDIIINVRTGKKIKIGRVTKIHSNKLENVKEICSGDIGALFGVDCFSGDTFSSPGYNISLLSMFIPKPVINLSINPKNNKSKISVLKALNRFSKEDPTFKTYTDGDNGDIIISGMGELHLDVYIERMRREYDVDIDIGIPKVAYKESITRKSSFDYTHKKQTGGSGQYGRVIGYIEPISDKEFMFENKIKGGSIPTQYISACEKGFKDCMSKGPKINSPIVGIKIVVCDGAFHSVDSSEKAFQTASKGAFLQAYLKALPIIQEPIMSVSIETPSEFQGKIISYLNKKRGVIVGTSDKNYNCVINAKVPLANMFGYSTVLRSLTRGKAQFTMELSQYNKVPSFISKEIENNVHK